MESYNVAILQPQGYAHSMALLEVGRLLQLSFQSLGFSCSLKINDLDRSAINVILGYHLLRDSLGPFDRTNWRRNPTPLQESDHRTAANILA